MTTSADEGQYVVEIDKCKKKKKKTMEIRVYTGYSLLAIPHDGKVWNYHHSFFLF